MDIPRRRIALLTAATFALLSSNPPAVAVAPDCAKAAATTSQTAASLTDETQPGDSFTNNAQPRDTFTYEAQTGDTFTYEVQPGDSLWKIVQRFQIDLDQLLELNPPDRLKRLDTGTRVTIPGQPSIQTSTQPVLAAQEQLVFSRSGEPFPYKQVLNCKLTAYTAGPESTGKRPGDPAYGITYSGKQAAEGRTIAVDPQVIPIGSKVYIEGIGFRTAEDTGGAVKGEHIDIFFNDIRTAIEFGVQKSVSVYILN